ncbi:hypothetical protein Q8A67_018246 [Cirrhinus molitorella]|uniref:Uncharacterized protein n=1 Tax=Cirrhinus molitorella TaxID=172907 RepID=A0AA88TH73_9TELE|nr:hypothetical protein Q8A67_018246 [Cirrhinus molitorella]
MPHGRNGIWTGAVWVALGDEWGRSDWHGCVLSSAAPAPWHTCAGSAPMDRGHLWYSGQAGIEQGSKAGTAIAVHSGKESWGLARPTRCATQVTPRQPASHPPAPSASPHALGQHLTYQPA